MEPFHFEWYNDRITFNFWKRLVCFVLLFLLQLTSNIPCCFFFNLFLMLCSYSAVCACSWLSTYVRGEEHLLQAPSAASASVGTEEALSKLRDFLHDEVTNRGGWVVCTRKQWRFHSQLVVTKIQSEGLSDDALLECIKGGGNTFEGHENVVSFLPYLAWTNTPLSQYSCARARVCVILSSSETRRHQLLLGSPRRHQSQTGAA